MKAKDVMSRDVVSVTPDTTVRQIAHLMVEHRIGSMPVLQPDGRIAGIVTQSDLLHRAEVGTEQRRKWWLRMFADADQAAREYTKTHGLHAADVMSTSVVSVAPDAELRDVADLLDRKRLKRVPVVDADRVVGMLTRGDLVRALFVSEPKIAISTSDDATMRMRILDAAGTQPWFDGALCNITVENGVVKLWGIVRSAEQRHALKVLIEETAGHLEIEDRLRIGIPSMMTA